MLDGERESDTRNDDKADQAESTERTANPFVRRLIPTVAAATLTLSGCLPGSGDGESDGGTLDDAGGGDDSGTVSEGVQTNDDGDISTAEVRDYCETFRDCDPSRFEQSHDSIDDCVDEQEYYLNYHFDLAADEQGALCADALEAWWECMYVDVYGCFDGEFRRDADAQSCFDDHYDSYYLHCRY